MLFFFTRNKSRFLAKRPHISTVLPAKSNNDVMFCLQSYQGLTDVSKMHSNEAILYFLYTGKDEVFTTTCICTVAGSL